MRCATPAQPRTNVVSTYRSDSSGCNSHTGRSHTTHDKRSMHSSEQWCDTPRVGVSIHNGSGGDKRMRGPSLVVLVINTATNAGRQGQDNRRAKTQTNRRTNARGAPTPTVSKKEAEKQQGTTSRKRPHSQSHRQEHDH